MWSAVLPGVVKTDVLVPAHVLPAEIRKHRRER